MYKHLKYSKERKDLLLGLFHWISMNDRRQTWPLRHSMVPIVWRIFQIYQKLIEFCNIEKQFLLNLTIKKYNENNEVEMGWITCSRDHHTKYKYLKVYFFSFSYRGKKSLWKCKCFLVLQKGHKPIAHFGCIAFAWERHKYRTIIILRSYWYRGCSQTTLTRFWLFLTLRWHFLPYERWPKVDIFGPPTPLLL